jgi:DNA-binding CsgD family transcriptional regulator
MSSTESWRASNAATKKRTESDVTLELGKSFIARMADRRRGAPTMTVNPDLRFFVTDSANRSFIIRTTGSRKSYTIGRGFDETAPDSDVVNIPDQLVSRKHCTLTWTDAGQWLLEDLDSTNGTVVEGAPPKGQVLLGRGDSFKIGGTVLRLEYNQPNQPDDDEDGTQFVGDATQVAPMSGAGRKAPNERLAGLTSREREVLDLLVSGMTNKEIARLLSISHRTIEAHRAKIMEKTQASNFPQLIRMTLNN